MNHHIAAVFDSYQYRFLTAFPHRLEADTVRLLLVIEMMTNSVMVRKNGADDLGAAQYRSSLAVVYGRT